MRCEYDGHISTFTYGADGLRRRSTVDGVATDCVLDGQNVVRELRGGTAYATYLIGPRGPEYRRDDTTNPKTVVWYLYDGLGSVVGEVDQQGNVTASRKYDVYGAVRDSGGTSVTDHKFVGSLGHATEDETGLIYMRARYMDPTLGRFISEDPGYDGGNWYTYADSNPVSMVDPGGQFTFLAAVAILLVVAMFAYYVAFLFGHEPGEQDPHIDPSLPPGEWEFRLERSWPLEERGEERAQNWIDNMKMSGTADEKMVAHNLEIAYWTLQETGV